MSYLKFSSSGIQPILASERSDCGLACLSMILNSHGFQCSLDDIKKQSGIYSRGISAKDLIEVSRTFGLNGYGGRVEDDTFNIDTPAILHWDMDHFVLLIKVKKDRIKIIDPSSGVVELSKSEALKHFTGIALFFSKAPNFKPRVVKKLFNLKSFIPLIADFKVNFSQIIITTIVIQFLVLLSPFFLQLILDRAIPSNDKQFLIILGLAFVGLSFIQGLTSYTRSWIAMYISKHLELRLNSSLLVSTLRLPALFFKNRSIGDLQSRFQSMKEIQNIFGVQAVEGIIDSGFMIIILFVLLYYSPILTGIVVVSSLIYTLIYFYSVSKIRKFSTEAIVQGAKADTVFLETIRGIDSIKLSCNEYEREKRWLHFYINQQNSLINAEKKGFFQIESHTVITGIERALLLTIGAILVLEESISIGMLIAFLAYRTDFISRISSLLSYLMQLKLVSIHLERISELALAKPESNRDGQGIELKENFCASIRIENLSFRYDHNQDWIFKNYNAEFPANKMSVIVGQSGSGKTTLLRLLLGLLEPSEGTIYINDVDIKLLGYNNLRNLSGVVLQDDILFEGSIRDNIAFFSHEIDDKRINEVLDKVSILNEINAMPMKTNTLIGDMGSSLSGGQIQRILLARALYKVPKLLFLDESTNALDIKNEKLINDHLKKQLITRIVIAHRPETISLADHIVDLDNLRDE